MDATGGIDDMTYTCLSSVTNAASQFENTYSNSNQQGHVMYVNTPQEPHAGISFHPAQLPTHSDAINNYQSSTEMNFLPQNGNNERHSPVLYPSAAVPLPTTTTTQSSIYPVRNGSAGDAPPIATIAQSSTTGSMQTQAQHIYTGGPSNNGANKAQPNGDVRQQYYILNNPGAVNGNMDVVKSSSSQSNLGQGDNVAIDVGGNPPQNGAAANNNNTVILVGANQVPMQLASGSQLLTMSQDHRGQVAVAKELQSMDQSEEPLYVNAKQYHRILKRREARAKLEALGRIPKQRKKYLHESRHLHAVNRRRMVGGKFATKP